MSNFSNAFRNQTNVTRTENGAFAYSTTGNACLNLFARIGGMRSASDSELVRLYRDARLTDETLADNMILYARNIREGGIGERRIARVLLKELVSLNPQKIERNFDTIVSAGRWDDLFVLMGTSLESKVLAYIKCQFRKDIVDMKAEKPISLLAKWLPSANTSSQETCRLARKVYTYLGLSERTYRKTLSALRKYLDIVEKKMSAQDFGSIDYQAVPSVAMTRYRSAFGRRDFERFDKYINAVTKGQAKINANTSYPYDLIMPYVNKAGCGWFSPNKVDVDKVLEAQWNALPNYVEGNHNVIVMSDVSGSMFCEGNRPIAASVSLGIYFAERNKGAYENMYLTFTDRPQLFELDPNTTVASRVNTVLQNCGYNTNLDGAFDAIYRTAVRAGEAPEALVIISDGEIDNFARRNDCESIVAKWQKTYAQSGLIAPKLIMWNVCSRGDRFLDKKGNPGIAYVSGCSASTFKELTTLITMDAVTAMTEILTKPQFSWK